MKPYVSLALLLSAVFVQPQNTQRVNYSALRLDAWRVLGPGGGGAQFNPTISAVDPNLVLVNCDMTGAYISEDGGDSWRMFNLRSVVRFFVLDPSHANIIYAATEGLYRSNDKGRSWHLLYPAPSAVSGVLISGDHAEEQIVTHGALQSAVQSLAIDPADSNTLFAVISTGKNSQLFHSTDSGATWEALAAVSSARKIYVDPNSPKTNRTIYLAGENSISVLENGALRLQKAPIGVNRFLDVAAGFLGKSKRAVFYATSGIDWRGGETGLTALYVSSDGGANWQTLSTDFLSAATKGSAKLELRAVGTSLHHPQTAYLSFRDHTPNLTPAQRSMGVAKTVDMGKTWHIVWKDTEVSSSSNLQDPWINERFGSSWGENPFALGVSPANAQICFGTDFGRTMRTRDGGKTWQGVYSHRLPDGNVTTTGLDVLTTHGIHFDPFDPHHWLVSFTDIGLFETHQDGTSWKEVTSRGIPNDWQNTSYWVVFDPKVKGRVWAAVSGTHDLPRPKMWRRDGVTNYLGGVVISDDGGRSWHSSSEGMPQTAPTHVLLDLNSPVAARTLYVCAFGRGVYKSTDGGRHWQLKNDGIEGREPFAWRLAQDSKGQLYLLVARRSEDGSIGTPQDGALYRSTDDAEHWQKLSLPAGSNAPNGLTIDPQDDRRLYLAAWGRRTSSQDIGGGIFMSTDAGETWRNVLSKDQHVFDVTVDTAAPGVLYATGFESSVWKSQDRGENWRRVKGYNFKWGQRVVPDPETPGMIYVCTFGGAIWHGPADLDSGEGADIATPIMMPGR